MDISIIIISYNTCALLRECLSSIYEKTGGVTYEIFVVDNASSDESCEMVEKEFSEVRLIRNSENCGFAKANNQAIKRSRGKYVFLLNSDTILENNASKVMLEFMEKHPRAAVCGPLLLNPDKTVQRSIDTYPTVTSMIIRLSLEALPNRYRRLMHEKYHPAVFCYSQRYQITDGWLTGAALMIRKAAFTEVGLLDEVYHFMMEDADFGLAVSRLGWETWFVPEAVVTHLLGASRNSLSDQQEIDFKIRFFRQHLYYVRKNMGLVRYGIYRTLVFCCYVNNLIRRVIASAMYPLEKRSLTIFKIRLARQMLLTSMEVGKDRIFEDQ